MQKIAKAVRILTTPPIFAALLCTLLFLLLDGSFASAAHYAAAVGFLTGLPLLAYPIAAAVPSLRKKGRAAQRNLALIFSVVGYVGGFLFAVLGGGAPVEKVLFGTYLISGIALALCTVLHFKASGHTCGLSGPVAMLSMFVSPWFLCGYSLLTTVVWSSRKLGRHTPMQLFVGTLIPIAAMLICRVQFLG